MPTSRSQRVEAPEASRWLPEARRLVARFKDARVLGEYGNDYGEGVVALLDSLRHNGTLRDALDDPDMCDGSNSYIKWEEYARRLEQLSRRPHR